MFQNNSTAMNSGKKRIIVSGVCCATEEHIVRKQLDDLIGNERYAFNPVTCELTLNHDVNESLVSKHLHAAGFGTKKKSELQQSLPFWEQHGNAVYAAVAALLTVTGILAQGGSDAVTLARGCFFAAIVIGGWRVFVKAARSVMKYAFDMNVLMSVAVIGAVTIDRWAEAAAVIVLFACSLLLESYSATRARQTIQSLVSLAPTQAAVIRAGKEILVPAEEVVPGEELMVRPGERIALDGIVVFGTSLVDQAPITGESALVEKHTGSTVYAGSINQRGVLRIRATSTYEDTTLARIVHAVEEAANKKPPVQQFVDRFARVYTPAMLGISALIATIPPFVLGESWEGWFYRALILLVIACPCALVISTPVTIVSALTAAARQGVLIKGGVHLETLGRVQAIAFDKTGTLTKGTPVVTDILPLNSQSKEEILTLAAAIERYSEHHIASAVRGSAAHAGIQYNDVDVAHFEAIPGRGVKAVINGKVYYLGNHDLCEERGYCSQDAETAMNALARQGKTAIVLGAEDEPLGIIAVADTARQQSQSAIRELKELGVREIYMISGDHKPAVSQIAGEVGVENVSAALLPEQKVEVVKQLQGRHGTVAVVGDGINDAPALAASSVGVAMGVTGTDVALESADVVLMADDLSKIPMLIRLSRRTSSILKQNIALALGLKMLFFILSVAGVATLWMAVLADDGAAILVILNGLRVFASREQEQSSRGVDFQAGNP
jgi:Cd2+/Zn2+-exporting ATPase